MLRVLLGKSGHGRACEQWAAGAPRKGSGGCGPMGLAAGTSSALLVHPPVKLDSPQVFFRRFFFGSDDPTQWARVTAKCSS